MVVVAIFVGVLGIVFIVMGCLMWKREKVHLLHDYHYDKVLAKDKKAFCAISGWGVMSIGIGLMITAVIVGITDSAWSFMALLVGFIVGLSLLIYAGLKYNH